MNALTTTAFFMVAAILGMILKMITALHNRIKKLEDDERTREGGTDHLWTGRHYRPVELEEGESVLVLAARTPQPEEKGEKDAD